MNLMIFEIVKFWNFQNWKFMEFFKLEIFLIYKIRNFSNCPNWKINKYLDLKKKLKNHNLAQKICNFGIVRPFGTSHYSQFCQFSYLPFDIFYINQFSQFLFPILATL